MIGTFTDRSRRATSWSSGSMPSRVSTTNRITDGRIDRQVDLVLDVPREVVHVGDAHAAGVDQLEEAVVVAHQVRDAVARDARLVVDDGNAHAGEPVKHAAFADVGPADDDDLRNAHDELSTMRTAKSRARIRRAARGKRDRLQSIEITPAVELRNCPPWFLTSS